MNTTRTNPANKYRAAIELLQRGRDHLVDELAEQVLDQGDFLIETPYLFNEMLEGQGTKLHFLGLLIAQLEQSAEQQEEAEARSAPPPPSKPRKPRARKQATSQASRESEPGEAG